MCFLIEKTVLEPRTSHISKLMMVTRQTHRPYCQCEKDKLFKLQALINPARTYMYVKHIETSSPSALNGSPETMVIIKMLIWQTFKIQYPQIYHTDTSREVCINENHVQWAVMKDRQLILNI